MTLVTELFLILTQNLVFSHLLGITPVVRAEGRRRMLLLSSGLSAVFILVSCTVLTALRPLLPAGELRLILPLCCAVLNGALDLICVLAAGLIAGEKARPAIVQIHAAACSGAVLGAVLLCFANAGTVSAAFFFGLRCAAGYLLAFLMLAAAAPVLNSNKMPASVRGWRGMYLYAGLIGLAVACINV